MLKFALVVGTTAFAAAICLDSGALAQDAATAKACAGDVKTFCAGVKPGGGRVKDCIKSHFKDLSGTCQAELLKAAAVSFHST
jgi:hypothetical protein